MLIEAGARELPRTSTRARASFREPIGHRGAWYTGREGSG